MFVGQISMEKLCHSKLCERPFLSQFTANFSKNWDWRQMERNWNYLLQVIYDFSLFWGRKNDVAPSSNNLKVHSFSNMPIFLWKTGTNREAGLGQPQYWKLMHHSTVSLHTEEGAELWQATYIFPPFTSIQYNLTVTAVILLQIRKNTE